MIPNSDEIAPKLKPFVTGALILICVVVYACQFQLQGPAYGDALLHFAFTPSSLMSPQFEAAGAPAVLSIFTAMFLHGGWGHLAGNMLYLWIFGYSIENAMGHVRFFVFYLLCGVAAALTMAFMDPLSTRPMEGASGAISGVLAAYMLIYPRARVTLKIPLLLVIYRLRVNPLWLLALWFAMQLLSLTWPDTSVIAWWAHVGGFTAGLALTPFFKSSGVPFFGPRAPHGPWNS